MSDSALPAISVEGVTKHFGGRMVVERTDLSIRRDEFFSILGPSGCGKTTLMRMIAGFEQPSSGSIRLNGVDVHGIPTRQRDLNMLFQSYALFPHLNVWDNVAFELKVRSRRGRTGALARIGFDTLNEAVAHALALVRMTGFEGRRPDQLSGGQRQRVALARAVVARPSVLLLDEPLGALDLQLRRQMQLELIRLQQEVGITFVYVTHDQEEALTMSDRIAVMSEGVVQQVGTAAEIYDRPVNRFVAGFIGTCNLLEVFVEPGRGGGPAAHIPGIGEVPATGAAASRASGAATLAIRPESVLLEELGEGIGEQMVPATVSRLTFHGQEWQIGLVLTNGDGMTATLPNGHRLIPLLRPGDAVALRWRASDARVLMS